MPRRNCAGIIVSGVPCALTDSIPRGRTAPGNGISSVSGVNKGINKRRDLLSAPQGERGEEEPERDKQRRGELHGQSGGRRLLTCRTLRYVFQAGP